MSRYAGRRLGERDAVISGIGRSEVGRVLGRTGLSLTVDAALQAIDDAGLTRDDIDGLSTYPGATSHSPGMSPCGVSDVQDALRLQLNWYSGGGEMPGQLGAVFNAVAAVSAGFANHQLAQIPLNQRRHAALYDQAIFRDPLTLEQYMSARIVSDPLCLYDCDVPCDGSCAVIVSRADAAADLKQVVRIEAVGSALTGRNSWDQRADLTETAAHDCTKMLWARTDLTVDDIDTAQLYDGFSFITITWLEALGFFPKGEAGPWLADGESRIGLGGQVPLNTNGGQLSGGRLHGYGYLYEACAQLRGDAAGRQVEGAEVAVVAAGGGPLGGCMLLTADR